MRARADLLLAVLVAAGELACEGHCSPAHPCLPCLPPPSTLSPDRSLQSVNYPRFPDDDEGLQRVDLTEGIGVCACVRV